MDNMDFQKLNISQVHAVAEGPADALLVDQNYIHMRRKIYRLSRNEQYGPNPEQYTRRDEYFVMDEDLRQSLEVIVNGREYETLLKGAQTEVANLNDANNSRRREITRLNRIIDDFWTKPWYKRVWLALRGSVLN